MNKNYASNFYVQVKEEDTGKVVKELGSMTEIEAIKVADKIDLTLSDDFYSEIVEK